MKYIETGIRSEYDAIPQVDIKELRKQQNSHATTKSAIMKLLEAPFRWIQDEVFQTAYFFGFGARGAETRTKENIGTFLIFLVVAATLGTAWLSLSKAHNEQKAKKTVITRTAAKQNKALERKLTRLKKVLAEKKKKRLAAKSGAATKVSADNPNTTQMTGNFAPTDLSDGNDNQNIIDPFNVNYAPTDLSDGSDNPNIKMF